MASARHKASRDWAPGRSGGMRVSSMPNAAPIRSAHASHAHAAGDVTWTIDLAMPATQRVSHRAAKRNATTATTLVSFAAALWLADAIYLVTHWR